MSEAVAFADAEQLVITYLTDRLAARGEVVDVSDTVDTDRPDRLVKVARTGGARRDLVTDEPQITVECWSGERQDAADLAVVVRAELGALQQQHVAETWVRSCTEVGGPAWNPDPDSGTPRYQLTVALNLRGHVL